MAERDLEGDKHGRRQSRELDRALLLRNDADEERKCDSGHGGHRLEQSEIGNALRVVLPPLPERER